MRSFPAAVISLALLASGTFVGTYPVMAAPEPREIRSVEFDDYFDVDLDRALPFPPGAGTALLLPRDGEARTQLVQIGERGWDDALVLELADSINTSLDTRSPHPRLVVLEGGLLSVRDVGSIERVRFDWRPLAIESPQGLAVDPASGSVFVLDGMARRVVRVQPGPGGSLDAAEALAAGRVDELALPGGAGDARGLGFDPSTRRLHVLSAKSKALYELGPDGALLDVRPVAGEAWRQPVGLVFTPSADTTDDPGQTSLFLASVTAAGAELTEWSFESPHLTALVVDETADLIRVIDTSRFSPPSPDPAGVAWDPDEDRLLVSDSEVNEMPIFTGDNVFETTRFGSLLQSRSTLDFSDEPTGVAIDRPGNRIFISDDTGTRSVYTVELGSDGRFATKDDDVYSFETEVYGSRDPEGVAYGDATLYWVDGVNSEVYWMVAGSDGTFDGRRDTVGQFDTARLGLTDPEGIEWNPANGNLFVIGEPDDIVFEITPSGSLVRRIDIAEANPKKPAGLAFAPSTEGSGWSLFVSDRRVDNDSDPRENDGKVYELAISGGVVARCGNGVREAGEECDGSDLGGGSCSDQGCSSGTPSCTASCTLDHSGCSVCPVCGNGIRESGEDCDGSDLGNATCTSEGFYCGSGIGCRSDCRYDTSSCIAGSCGDDLVQAVCGELCDGSALGGETCLSRGWNSGELACQTDCSGLDESDCSLCDNDGVCEADENCGNCPHDCFGGGPVCGNHVCEVDAGEDCVSCPSDCNGLQTKRKSKRYCCGDGAGDGPIGCGDARCSAGGNSCDSAPVPSWCCGDGTCEAEENLLNCGIDCGG